MFKSNRDYKLYIEDIANECKNIKKFVGNITYNEFTENLEKVYAVGEVNRYLNKYHPLRKAYDIKYNI
jgi:uncharacterized protein with HEPN domain